MKILFLREKYADGNPELGMSDGSYMISTLPNGHVAVTIHYDVIPEGRNRDDYVAEMAANVQPSVVMFSHLISWGERNISKDTWQWMRSSLKARVVGVWHEGVAPDVVRVADEHADCVDLNLFLDTKQQFLQHTKRPEKCFGLFDPRNPTRFKPRSERPIAVFFNGTLLDRAIRMQGYSRLMAPRMFGYNEPGIPITKVGGRHEMFLSEDKMVELLGSSKICLNFADAGDTGIKHYKGRVAEALLSGCLLMEWENEETASILTPFRDYVPFSTPDDLYQKTVFYLTHESDLQKIAANGRAVALERLDGREFWSVLFERLERLEVGHVRR